MAAFIERAEQVDSDTEAERVTDGSIVDYDLCNAVWNRQPVHRGAHSMRPGGHVDIDRDERVHPFIIAQQPFGVAPRDGTESDLYSVGGSLRLVRARQWAL